MKRILTSARFERLFRIHPDVDDIHRRCQELVQVVLSWRTNYVGFTLQSSEGLSPPVVSAGHFWVTNSISGGSQFFRLRK
jgi:hypothetical protein